MAYQMMQYFVVNRIITAWLFECPNEKWLIGESRGLSSGRWHHVAENSTLLVSEGVLFAPLLYHTNTYGVTCRDFHC